MGRNFAWTYLVGSSNRTSASWNAFGILGNICTRIPKRGNSLAGNTSWTAFPYAWNQRS